MHQLKTQLSPLATLVVDSESLAELEHWLNQQILQAPKLWLNAPLVLESQKTLSEAEWDSNLRTLKSLNLNPVAIRTHEVNLIDWAKSKKLAVFEPSLKRVTKTLSTPISRPVQIHKQPIRSGQQVYAKDSDLIVLGSVGQGAEVVADGHVQVMGTIRGRAIAGAQGDEQARILCQSLEAELLAIAGIFSAGEDLNQDHSKTALVELEEGRLSIQYNL